MKTAFVVSGDRIAPCFPGNILRVYEHCDKPSEYKQVDTAGWEVRDWVDGLRRLDVEMLVCVSISRFLWGALRGNGIAVAVDIVGDIDSIVEKWVAGEIESSPDYGLGYGVGRGGRRKGNGRGHGRPHRCGVGRACGRGCLYNKKQKGDRDEDCSNSIGRDNRLSGRSAFR